MDLGDIFNSSISPLPLFLRIFTPTPAAHLRTLRVTPVENRCTRLSAFSVLISSVLCSDGMYIPSSQHFYLIKLKAD
jgi:hypothetical protein